MDHGVEQRRRPTEQQHAIQRLDAGQQTPLLAAQRDVAIAERGEGHGGEVHGGLQGVDGLYGRQQPIGDGPDQDLHAVQQQSVRNRVGSSTRKI
jgi:hypothetical protein